MISPVGNGRCRSVLLESEVIPDANGSNMLRTASCP